MGEGYQLLVVWQKGMDFVVHVYSMTKRFPKEEIYALTAQLRRAAVSVPSNIAEGSRRATSKDRNHFFVIALGSLSEAETQLEIARRLGYVSDAPFVECMTLADELSRMLNRLARSS
jgi:four helix bundle protein